MEKSDKQHLTLPLLPLRDVVVFPYMVMPLFVGREESILALEAAMAQEKKLFLLGQKDAEVDVPGEEDVYTVGTVATILQLLKLPDGTVKLLVEGVSRARRDTFIQGEDYLAADISLMAEEGDDESPEMKLKIKTLLSQFEKLVELGKGIPKEVYTSIAAIPKACRLTDSIAAHIEMTLDVRQQLLELNQLSERVDFLTRLVAEALEMLDVEKRVQGRVRSQVEKSQRQYYLSEKIKAIQKEMGDLDDNGIPANELEELEEKIKASGMPKEAMDKSLSELKKLRMMSPMSAEATVCRNYIDTMLLVPWKKTSKVSHDLIKAMKILDADHYGLKEVKERIVEYLAVQKRVKQLKGPILCLVGPPGVGKTSLGESIARATGREFVRVSLGGVRDEAEIR
ncbi:MAG TPA: endopeptidase La, partial [Coxiellaceae bacterium]|nr:endopeptidase La [Coxiellaceae bacterium]